MASEKIPNIPVPTPQSDERAAGESAGMAAGIDLSNREQTNKLNLLVCEDKMKGHVHRVQVCVVYVSGAIAIGFVGVLAMHYAFPTYVLTDAQAGKLQKFVLSGGGGIALGRVSKKGAPS